MEPLPSMALTYLNVSNIKEVEKEIKDNKTEGLQKLLTVVSEHPEAVRNIQSSSDLGKRCVALIHEAEKHSELNQKQVQTVIHSLALNGILSNKNFADNVVIVGKGGVKVAFNEEILRMLCPYFDKMLASGMEKGIAMTKQGLRIDLSHKQEGVSADILQIFKDYLQEGKLPNDVIKLAEFLKFLDKVLVNQNIKFQVLDNISKYPIATSDDLERYFKALDIIPFAAEEERFRLQQLAVKQYINNLKIPCNETEEGGLRAGISIVPKLLAENKDFAINAIEHFVNELEVTSENDVNFLREAELMPKRIREKISGINVTVDFINKDKTLCSNLIDNIGFFENLDKIELVINNPGTAEGFIKLFLSGKDIPKSVTDIDFVINENPDFKDHMDEWILSEKTAAAAERKANINNISKNISIKWISF